MRTLLANLAASPRLMEAVYTGNLHGSGVLTLWLNCGSMLATDNSVVRRQITQQIVPETVTRIIVVQCVPEAHVCPNTLSA